MPADVNAFWENQSFHNYANYATSGEFRSGLARLRELGHATTCAVMCAEAVWWRCHRRIIADYLIAAGETVFHILGVHHVNSARLTEGAGVTRQAVTKHLQVLSEAGLVEGSRRGRESLWELDPAPLAAARRDLEVLSRRWDETLDRLRAFVER